MSPSQLREGKDVQTAQSILSAHLPYESQRRVDWFGDLTILLLFVWIHPVSFCQFPAILVVELDHSPYILYSRSLFVMPAVGFVPECFGM